MKKLLKLMLAQNILRAPEGDDGADGGGSAGKDNPDLAAQVAELKAQLAALQGKGKEPGKEPTVLEKAQEEAAKAAQAAQAKERLQSAIKFNLGISKFVEDHKDNLTKLSAGIVTAVTDKQFADEEKKASVIQASLLSDFFGLQENIDAAPEELKERILTYKALAQDEKEKQAAKYWDTLTLTIGRKEMLAKVEAAKLLCPRRDEKDAALYEFYRWLPSDAKNPDPEHQLLYGKIFRVGEGDKEGNMPGERYGCRCGIEWLTDEEVSPNTAQEKAVLEHTSKSVSSKIQQVYDNAISGEYARNRITVNLGQLPRKTIKRIKDKAGLDLKEYAFEIDGESIWHTIRGHGNVKEYAKNQIVITKEKLTLIPHILQNFDKVVVENKRGNSLRLKFVKQLGREYTEVVVVGKRKKHLLFKTFYGKQ